MIRYEDTIVHKVLLAPVDKGQAGGTRQHCRAQSMLALVYELRRPVLIKNIDHLTDCDNSLGTRHRKEGYRTIDLRGEDRHLSSL